MPPGSCYPFQLPHPEGADRDPRGWQRETPLHATTGKYSLALTLDPQPLQGAAASGTGPEVAGCLSPGWAHQENSQKQMFTSCSGLGFSGDTGRILPACGVGAEGATRTCEARPQALLMEVGSG